MTIEERQGVINQLDPFWKAEVGQKIFEYFQSHGDLETVYIGAFTAAEFIALSKRTVSQLGRVLQTQKAALLPLNYSFSNEFGGSSLTFDLQALTNSINSSDFTSAAASLHRLIYYEIVNGFWEEDIEGSDARRYESLDKLSASLELISKKTKTLQKLNEESVSGLKKQAEALETLVAAKNKELSEIEAMLGSARNNDAEIQKHLTSAATVSESINGLLAQQKRVVDEGAVKTAEANKQIQDAISDLEKLRTGFDKQINSAGEKNNEFEQMLGEVRSKTADFEKGIATLNELIGKEGAHALFNTFNDRKNALKWPVWVWGGIVLLTGLGTFYLVGRIFAEAYLKGDGVNWNYLLVNSIKTLPLMLVFFFTIRQYARERTFQEEYAFRSAIALTVQAYGDIAGSKKEELIMKAVSTIYSLPQMMKEKYHNFFGYRSRVLSDTLKEFNEVIKNIKLNQNV